MERLTSKRAQGPGYWTPHKKDELTQRLGAYEDTGLSPEDVKNIVQPMCDTCFKLYLETLKKNVEKDKEDGLGYVSILCQLTKDITKGDGRYTYTTEQLRRIFELAK